MSDVEIEVRFPEIDADVLMQQLRTSGAQDLGERFLSETIFYDKHGEWHKDRRRTRVRTNGDVTTLTYKAGHGEGMHTTEHELVVDDYNTACKLLQGCDLQVARTQEKKRHSFQLGECLVEFDTWPGIPTYVEIEGPSVEALRTTAQALNLDWSARYEQDALALIEEFYDLDLQQVTEFTFQNFPTQLTRVIK